MTQPTASVIERLRSVTYKDIRAVEHAEYLAKGVEAFMAYLNEQEAVRNIPDQHALTDHWRNVQSLIYEFRKRAAKSEGSGDAGKLREALQEAALELKALGSCTVLARVEAALTPASVPAPVEAGWRKLKHAAEEFIRKVEAGEARSKQSYGEFKAALAEINTASVPAPVERDEGDRFAQEDIRRTNEHRDRTNNEQD